MQITGYVGFVLLAALGWIFEREYVAYVAERELWYKELLAFLRFAEREVGCFMRTPEEICEGLGDGVLRSEGAVLDILRARELSSDEFLRSAPINKEDKEELFSFFKSFGTGYHDEETRALAGMRSRFEESARRAAGECAKNRRLAPIIYAFSFASVLLLLL